MSRRSSFNSARGNRVEIGQKRRNARQTFEKNLLESGLEIEHEYRAVRSFFLKILSYHNFGNFYSLLV